MNEIEDVHHHDFTTATEWEVFIATLEDIMRKWKVSDENRSAPLKKGDFVNLPWETQTQTLSFAGQILQYVVR